MKKEFLPYERAVKLRELGFDEPCLSYWEDKAFRWFREKHQLDTSINNTVYSKYNDTLSKKYSGVIDDKSVFTHIGFYDTYEEAELACLDKLIEIVEIKQRQPNIPEWDGPYAF